MITSKEVERIAKLARLGLRKEEIQRFQKELSAMWDYFHSLKEIDVSQIDPTFRPTEYVVQQRLQQLREDKAKPQSPEVVAMLMKAAPKKKEGHIQVKAVL